MKEHRHLGSYGLVIENDEILLVDKVGGPYDGKLDLPGGSLEFGETPEEALKRELQEEVGINVDEYELYDCDSTLADWYREDGLTKVHHIGMFYKITSYSNDIKEIVELDSKNDDSLGGKFYPIDKLKKEQLSNIAILELEKLGYNLK